MHIPTAPPSAAGIPIPRQLADLPRFCGQFPPRTLPLGVVDPVHRKITARAVSISCRNAPAILDHSPCVTSYFPIQNPRDSVTICLLLIRAVVGLIPRTAHPESARRTPAQPMLRHALLADIRAAKRSAVRRRLVCSLCEQENGERSGVEELH